MGPIGAPSAAGRRSVSRAPAHSASVLRVQELAFSELPWSLGVHGWTRVAMPQRVSTTRCHHVHCALLSLQLLAMCVLHQPPQQSLRPRQTSQTHTPAAVSATPYPLRHLAATASRRHASATSSACLLEHATRGQRSGALVLRPKGPPKQAHLKSGSLLSFSTSTSTPFEWRQLCTQSSVPCTLVRFGHCLRAHLPAPPCEG